ATPPPRSSSPANVTTTPSTVSVPGKEAQMSGPVSNPPLAPAPSYSASTASGQPTLPTGYTRTAGFSLSPEALQWIAPGALVLSLILTVFSWNGVFPAGHPASTQSAWGALFGRFSTDPVADEVLRYESPTGDQKPLDKLVHSNWLMLIYLPLLMAGVALAVGSALLPKLQLQLPPQAEQLAPWRMAIVAGVAFLLTAMLALQMLRGFGLENAVVEDFHAKMRSDRQASKTPEKVTSFETRRAIALDGLGIQQTTAVRLALFLNVLAVFGAALTFLLHRRAHLPWPRVEAVW